MFARTLLALAAAFGGAAQAATLAGDGQWAVFDVALDLSGNLGWIDIDDGSALSFAFTVPDGSFGMLTVVDGGLSGDQFGLSFGPLLAPANTSAPVNNAVDSIGLDFDAALANPQYSRGVFTLGAGNYVVSGSMVASTIDPTYGPLFSTVGGIKLEVSPVPEPATLASMLAGLALMASALRRRVR